VDPFDGRAAVIYRLDWREPRSMSRREGTLADDEARARLYEVMRSDAFVDDRLEAALEVGLEYFGVDHAYIAEIDEATDDWTVVIATDPPDGAIPEGLNVDLATTYCRHTIERESVLALHDAPEQGYAGDVAFDAHGLHCYHGAPVVVDDETYGTVCFSSRDPRADPFSETEKAFTQLVAQMAGHEIERHRDEVALDRRERELEERREIYRAVVDANFDLVFRLDDGGRFTFVSSTVSDLLGYDPADLHDRSFVHVFPDEETTELGRRLFRGVFDGRTVEERYVPIETARGDTVDVDIRATPIYRTDPSGPAGSTDEIVGVQGTAREATRRKRRERLIRVLNRVLRHNLRNDMTVVRGYAEQLRRELTGEAATTAGRIVDATDRLIELGETARELQRTVANAPEIEARNVVSPVRTATDRIDERYPDASIVLDAPETVMARSAPRLEIALEELLDNAAKHGGDHPSVEVSVTADGDEVTIIVADDGPGLPEQERAVLAGGRETPLEHGSGLGLWLVYWIVASLEGDLELPATETGTTVVVRLPAAARDPDDVTAA
jgi:PAS domain S-box-containing protein